MDNNDLCYLFMSSLKHPYREHITKETTSLLMKELDQAASYVLHQGHHQSGSAGTSLVPGSNNHRNHFNGHRGWDGLTFGSPKSPENVARTILRTFGGPSEERASVLLANKHDPRRRSTSSGAASHNGTLTNGHDSFAQTPHLQQPTNRGSSILSRCRRKLHLQLARENVLSNGLGSNAALEDPHPTPGRSRRYSTRRSVTLATNGSDHHDDEHPTSDEGATPSNCNPNLWTSRRLDPRKSTDCGSAFVPIEQNRSTKSISGEEHRLIAFNSALLMVKPSSPSHAASSSGANGGESCSSSDASLDSFAPPPPSLQLDMKETAILEEDSSQLEEHEEFAKGESTKIDELRIDRFSKSDQLAKIDEFEKEFLQGEFSRSEKVDQFAKIDHSRKIDQLSKIDEFSKSEDSAFSQKNELFCDFSHKDGENFDSPANVLLSSVEHHPPPPSSSSQHQLFRANRTLDMATPSGMTTSTEPEPSQTGGVGLATGATAMSTDSSISATRSSLQRIHNRMCTSYRLKVSVMKNPVDLCLLPNEDMAIADYDNGLLIINDLGEVIEHKKTYHEVNACGVACLRGSSSSPSFRIFLLVVRDGTWTINVYRNFDLIEMARCPTDAQIENWALRRLVVCSDTRLHLMASGETKSTIWTYEFERGEWRVLLTENGGGRKATSGNYNDMSVEFSEDTKETRIVLCEWRRAQLWTLFLNEKTDVVEEKSIKMRRVKGQEWIVQGPHLAVLDEQADILVYDGSGKLFLFDGESYKCKKIVADLGRGEVSALTAADGWVFALCRYKKCIEAFMYKDISETRI